MGTRRSSAAARVSRSAAWNQGVGCLLGEHIHLVANPTHSASDTRVMNKLSPIERWRAQVDRLRSGVGLIYPGKSDKCQ